MILFIFGVFVGAVLGVFVAGLLNKAKSSDERERMDWI